MEATFVLDSVLESLPQHPSNMPLYGPKEMIDGKEVALGAHTLETIEESNPSSHSAEATRERSPDTNEDLNVNILKTKEASSHGILPFMHAYSGMMQQLPEAHATFGTPESINQVQCEWPPMTPIPQMSQHQGSLTRTLNACPEEYDTFFDFEDESAGMGLSTLQSVNTEDEVLVYVAERITKDLPDKNTLAKVYNQVMVGRNMKSLLRPKTLHDHNEAIRVLSHHMKTFDGVFKMAAGVKKLILKLEDLKEILTYYQYLGVNHLDVMDQIMPDLEKAYGYVEDAKNIIMDIVENAAHGKNSSEKFTLTLCLFPMFAYKESDWLYKYFEKTNSEPPTLVSTSVLAKAIILIITKGKLANPPSILDYLRKAKVHPSIVLPTDIGTLYSPSWSSDVSLDICYKITHLIMTEDYSKAYSQSKCSEDVECYVNSLFNSTIGLSKLLQEAESPQEFVMGNQQKDVCNKCGEMMGPVCTCMNCGKVRIISFDGSDRPACSATANVLTKDQIYQLGSDIIPPEFIGPVFIANSINTVKMIKAIECAITDYTKMGINSNFRALEESLCKSKEMEQSLMNLYGTFQSTLSQVTNHLNSSRSCIEASTKATQEFSTAMNNNTQALNTLSPLGVQENMTLVRDVVEFLTRETREKDQLITEDIVKRVISFEEDVLEVLGLSLGVYEDPEVD